MKRGLWAGGGARLVSGGSAVAPAFLGDSGHWPWPVLGGGGEGVSLWVRLCVRGACRWALPAQLNL